MHRFGETERLYQPIGMPTLVRSASAEPFSQAAEIKALLHEQVASRSYGQRANDPMRLAALQWLENAASRGVDVGDRERIELELQQVRCTPQGRVNLSSSISPLDPRIRIACCCLSLVSQKHSLYSAHQHTHTHTHTYVSKAWRRFDMVGVFFLFWLVGSLVSQTLVPIPIRLSHRRLWMCTSPIEPIE